jgi:hypothetical protein
LKGEKTKPWVFSFSVDVPSTIKNIWLGQMATVVDQTRKRVLSYSVEKMPHVFHVEILTLLKSNSLLEMSELSPKSAFLVLQKSPYPAW